MKFANRNLFLESIKRAPAGDDGDAGGGSGGGEEKATPTLEELQSQLTSLQEENTKIKSKNTELLDETKTAKQKAREREEAAQTASDEAARKSGDVEALENSWKTKYSDLETKLNSEIELMTSAASKEKKTAIATSIAAELSDYADAIMPHINKRIASERQEDGSFKTVILDNEGRPSALTIDELKKDIESNPMLAPLIKGTQANGGGAPGGSGAGASAKPGSKEAQIDAVRKRLQKKGL
jgi:chromosome segregation ATPase